MTTIILTIIGVLLAAIAALMVIFYGGDAFNSGTISARANNYINVGANFSAAVQLFKADGGNVGALRSLNDLRGGSPETDYLKVFPSFDGATVVVDGGSFTIEGVNPRICSQINRNLGAKGNPIAPTPLTRSSYRMGCLPASFPDGSGTFFVSPL